ncbi:UDP-N-acetylmuramoyl-tripeptide--D-alanyl-D-alanine ligase [Crocinitomix sp.]|nr:UDP-N-acetylmuramoyl-tripeptide--D-alanyl-D-alanine ligase [Crocinitomix sp.]
MKLANIYQLFLESDGITTDTRNLKKNALFFALKGANFNGNEFALQAIEAGCAFAIVDEEIDTDNTKIIKVDNVLNTLQQLANHHRNQFDIPVIGITGSNGKTTSKELAAAVLKKKYNVLMTEGNLNNHLGVPFTLLRLNGDHEIAIIEMGANKPGDIAELVAIAEPNFGMITNIGAAHIEGFGSLKGVIQTKKELYDYVGEHEGHIFFNEDDPVLTEILPSNTSLFGFGEKTGIVQGKLIAQSPLVEFMWSNISYKSPILDTQLVGKYNFTNFLAAISVGVYFEVAYDDINEAICEYTPSNNRSQITKTDKNTIIVDCYNANATSMKAALESFDAFENDKKLAILGDMLELGDISKEEHEKVIEFLQAHNLDAILVGNEMSKCQSNFPTFETWQELVDANLLNDRNGEMILLKGSRGIKLESLIPYL